jgi:hypothetical protein
VIAVTGSKNSTQKQEINRRRQIISRLRHEGVRNQQAIADRLRDDYNIVVTRQTVSNDCRALNKLWRQSAAKDTDKYMREMERQYRFVFQQSLAAWERSLEDKEAITQESAEGQSAGRTKVQIKTEGQSGNPAHLRNAMEALRAIRDMRGLDAPDELDVNIARKIEFFEVAEDNGE